MNQHEIKQQGKKKRDEFVQLHMIKMEIVDTCSPV